MVLYELLTGALPFPRAQALDVGYLETVRRIREEEPMTPSRKLLTSDDLPAIAVKHNLEPKRLVRFVAGDLDWIVTKCLEKDPNRRYQTAIELGRDLDRFLAGEPVFAGPPSVGYRALKYVRRNKAIVIATLLVSLASIAGVVGTTIGLVQADRAKQSASADRQAKDAAERESKRSLAAMQPLLDELYERIMHGDKATPSEMNAQLTQALERLVQLYEASDNATAAKRWRQVLAESRAAEEKRKQ